MISLLAIYLLASTALLHPVHETVSEVEWNDQSGRVEVALRLHVLDEQWLSKNHRQDVEISRWGVAYLRKNFQLSEHADFRDVQPAADAETDRSQAVKYHWIGRKSEGAHVWWYFEIQPARATRPKWIRQRMFFERDDRYTNRIIVLDQSPRHSILCTPDKPIARLDKQADESSVADQAKEPAS